MDDPREIKVIAGREYAIGRSRITGLRLVDEAQLPEQIVQNNRAVASAMHTQGQPNPDMIWVQFILDAEGGNTNRDYMPRPSMMKSYASAKWKPFDMDHIIKEDASMVGMDPDNPPTRNTIYGVITHAALSWKDGTLLTEQEIKELDRTDVVGRKDEDRLCVCAWAGLYHFLFPKTVADVLSLIDSGDMHVSMERWIAKWDFLVANPKGEYETVDRKKAESIGIFDSWATAQAVNGKPIYRRSLEFIYGGCASTTNPAQRLSTFVPLDPVKAVAHMGESEVLKILYRRHCEIHAAFAVTSCEDQQRELIAEHERVTRAIAALQGKI